MKNYCYGIAVLLLIGFAIIGFRHVVRPRLDEESVAVLAGAKSQLKLIYTTISSETQSSSNSFNYVFPQLISEFRSSGWDFFRLATGTNHVLIAINPDDVAWNSPTNHTKDVAAYWPLRIRVKDGDSGFVVVNFGGNISVVSELPNWKPKFVSEENSPRQP